jgi:light-regulated signal transduction histidine kinase (bacteriophytochrome)
MATDSTADLEHFAYAVAHDLQEPFRTISMFSELLIREGQLDPNGTQLAQFIVDGVKRMGSLFEGLRTFAVSGFDDHLRPLDLGPVVADALQNLAHAISVAGASVTVDPLPMVMGNEKHLLCVMQNLLINAIKYRRDVPVVIHVAAERRGADWIIRVKDNGIGILPEHFDSIFELWARLHGPETPGAGLGLAVCRKIVEALGGSIWVESKLGAGSTFCFRIGAANSGGAAQVFTNRYQYSGGVLMPGIMNGKDIGD